MYIFYSKQKLVNKCLSKKGEREILISVIFCYCLFAIKDHIITNLHRNHYSKHKEELASLVKGKKKRNKQTPSNKQIKQIKDKNKS